MTDILQAAAELKPFLRRLETALALLHTDNADLTAIKNDIATIKADIALIKARLPAALDASGGLKTKEQ